MPALERGALSMGNTRKRVRGQRIGKKKTKRFRRFWRRFIENHYNELIAYAGKFANSGLEPGEIVHVTYQTLMARVPNPILITHLDLYVRRVSLNVLRDSVRRRTKRNEVCIEDIMKSTPNNPALLTDPRILERLELAESLENAAKGARRSKKSRQETTKSKKRFELMVKGCTVAEIAQILDETPDHAKYMQRKLVDAVRKKSNKRQD